MSSLSVRFFPHTYVTHLRIVTEEYVVNTYILLGYSGLSCLAEDFFFLAHAM